MTIRRWITALGAALTAWLLVIALVMRFTDAATGAVAVLPSSAFAERVPNGIAIVDRGPFWVTLRSDQPDLAVALYRAGALLVLPAGLPGCLPLPEQGQDGKGRS